MKLSHLIIGIALAVTASLLHAQTMEYGPLQTDGVNDAGYPLFQMRCSQDRCVGLGGKDLGSPEAVARYMPPIRAEDIQRLGYECYVICYDQNGQIVGSPSPNYRNPYARP